MARIPFIYTWRSLWTRRTTTILTLGGVSLVVFVFAAVLMLAYGVEEALTESGSDDNVIALRKAATSELPSQIGRDAANILKTHPEIAQLPDGKPIVSSEVYVIINLSKKETHDMGNVAVRGISPEASHVRPQVKLLRGRMLQFGTREIVAGKNIHERFEGCELGSRLQFGGDHWTIVGHFEADGNSFESEIWGDVEQLMPAFGRPVFSSATLRLRNPSDFATLKERVTQDPRTQYVELKIERQYYREQSQLMADFIRVLGLIVTIIFSIGAMIGAMITMYAAVANRTVDIGTLRAVGFRRRSILAAFMFESLLLGLIGGTAGILLASFMSFITVSTTNFGTFSELAFRFTVSPSVVTSSFIFSIVMGFIGGFLPSLRAARLNIVNALRSA